MKTDQISINLHSSIRIGGTKVLYLDPWQLPEQTNDADYVFVTHSHYDHYSVEDIAKVRKAGTVLIVPDGMREQVVRDTGIGAESVIGMKAGESIETDGISITAVAAYNPEKPFHPHSDGFLGFAVSMDDVVYYYAGDTDCTPEVKNVRCDIALLPIGGKFTMDAAGAAEAAKVICPKTVIPVHYGTFEHIAGKEAVEELKRLLPADIELVCKI